MLVDLNAVRISGIYFSIKFAAKDAVALRVKARDRFLEVANLLVGVMAGLLDAPFRDFVSLFSPASALSVTPVFPLLTSFSCSIGILGNIALLVATIVEGCAGLAVS